MGRGGGRGVGGGHGASRLWLGSSRRLTAVPCRLSVASQTHTLSLVHWTELLTVQRYFIPRFRTA